MITDLLSDCVSAFEKEKGKSFVYLLALILLTFIYINVYNYYYFILYYYLNYNYIIKMHNNVLRCKKFTCNIYSFYAVMFCNYTQQFYVRKTIYSHNIREIKYYSLNFFLKWSFTLNNEK